MDGRLVIQNLKCGGCANTIITQLSKLDGIDTVKVDNATNQVKFSYLSKEALEKVTDKLSQLGYPIEGTSNSLPKKAKSFVSCAIGRISK
ncbi:MAG: heavy-metal-associated domain-containing protein [Winogradskyella sp.]|uniref:heavy-metal-associated domain-containing protein n=1 Tax=Winogradskyella sp. TaxID=1883156 RepID=UPI0025E32BE1|nr:heavy metal-associated domain-containing protein [Winogradskyella sp.]NRB83993.1 heavy-metal-associated domain-containing protein [Winogradskyella sp.]